MGKWSQLKCWCDNGFVFSRCQCWTNRCRIQHCILRRSLTKKYNCTGCINVLGCNKGISMVETIPQDCELFQKSIKWGGLIKAIDIIYLTCIVVWELFKLIMDNNDIRPYLLSCKMYRCFRHIFGSKHAFLSHKYPTDISVFYYTNKQFSDILPQNLVIMSSSNNGCWSYQYCKMYVDCDRLDDIQLQCIA